MLSRIRDQIGTAGLVVAVVALVAALGGGAVAATNSSSDGKATASAKGKKGPRGPKGAPGPTGPAGPAGPAGAKGDTGADGAAGAAGAKGATGATGTNGVSTTTIAATPAECPDGGIKVLSGSAPAKVCNGADGADGTTGFTDTLPSGKTETGTWAFSGQPTGGQVVKVPISFPIPLAAEIPDLKALAPGEGEFGVKCTGSVASPTAAAGYLCAYTGSLTAAVWGNEFWLGSILKPYPSDVPSGAGTTGAVLQFATTGVAANGHGTFAVTAP